jgi:exopolysaccharide/PEP-CTERM locus tyrosine autokinase
MTEQSKIPVPPDQQPSEGKSLLERANSAFGFTPAPVPAGIAIRARRVTVEEVEHVTLPETPPAAPQATSPVPQEFTPPPVPQDFTPPPAEIEPALTVEPVRFTGPKHRIDREALRRQGMIVPDGAVTALLEEFRIVKRQILQSAREARHDGIGAAAQRVLVCSPLPGEGKTFTATNLALAIAAEKDSEVLLVDADFAKPSVLSVLGLPGGKGLMDALADPTIRVEDCVIGTDVPGLFVLPAGSQTNSDSEFLTSNRTGQVLDRLTQGAPNRMVIFDSPPALAASPAAELARHVAQALLVVRADSTGQSAIEDALSLLANCPEIRLLLNAANFSPSGRRFGSYYGYGE